MGAGKLDRPGDKGMRDPLLPMPGPHPDAPQRPDRQIIDVRDLRLCAKDVSERGATAAQPTGSSPS
jgi:hypothetical protein